jgi:hypothetical protein
VEHKSSECNIPIKNSLAIFLECKGGREKRCGALRTYATRHELIPCLLVHTHHEVVKFYIHTCWSIQDTLSKPFELFECIQTTSSALLGGQELRRRPTRVGLTSVILARPGLSFQASKSRVEAPPASSSPAAGCSAHGNEQNQRPFLSSAPRGLSATASFVPILTFRFACGICFSSNMSKSRRIGGQNMRTNKHMAFRHGCMS